MEKQPTNFTVLVTGANSGLGFAICCRLIDEFLFTRPQSQTLHLLFSTRDSKKSGDTLSRLNAHLQKTLREANRQTAATSLLLEKRIKLEGVLVDLLQLSTIKALAEQLLRRGEVLDAIVCNAGITGWSHLNWPKAVWHVLTDLVYATTYPTYPVTNLGLLAKPQHPRSDTKDAATDSEPRLGQVFTANVFGHYLLVHWLRPLLSGASRIVWISSISAVAESFDVTDLQGLQAPMAYEGSKRLTDLLVLTSELPATRKSVEAYLPATKADARPKMYVTHPGVIGTSIADLHWTIAFFMVLAFYAARLLGSPWHPVEPYKGAVSAAFTVLAPASQLTDLEEREGKGKWGSATGVYGEERVARTEVSGWGFGGRVGHVPTGSVPGNVRGRKNLTKEAREEFEDDGRKVWQEMEQLRVGWEKRLGPIDQTVSVDL